ncbi:MAG: organomercurial transporter MerC [Gammaproteobacteria bacterium]|nr:organomercurial transporter MerC [Gammaproteobacteria bacterium]
MRWLTSWFDKTGALGAIIAAMGCASCFPALGALAASLGLGFLAHFEGLFLNTLLPIFAWIALGANLLAFISHRRVWRLLTGVIGPTLVLLTLDPLWSYDWSTYVFYAGLMMMLAVAVWDIVSPPAKRCAVKTTPEVPS